MRPYCLFLAFRIPFSYAARFPPPFGLPGLLDVIFHVCGCPFCRARFSTARAPPLPRVFDSAPPCSPPPRLLRFPPWFLDPLASCSRSPPTPRSHGRDALLASPSGHIAVSCPHSASSSHSCTFWASCSCLRVHFLVHFPPPRSLFFWLPLIGPRTPSVFLPVVAFSPLWPRSFSTPSWPLPSAASCSRPFFSPRSVLFRLSLRASLSFPLFLFSPCLLPLGCLWPCPQRAAQFP